MTRAASRASVTRDLHRHSSAVYTALALNGRTGQSDCVHFASCPVDPQVSDAVHFWQIDDLRHTDLAAAVARAHRHLLDHGWTGVVLHHGLPGPESESETWGRHPHEPYAVHILTVSDRHRIAVSVSTPAFRIIPGS